MYIGDSGNHALRTVTNNNAVKTLVGTGNFKQNE